MVCADRYPSPLAMGSCRKLIKCLISVETIQKIRLASKKFYATNIVARRDERKVIMFTSARERNKADNAVMIQSVTCQNGIIIRLCPAE